MITIFTAVSAIGVGYFAKRNRRGAKAGKIFMLIVYLVVEKPEIFYTMILYAYAMGMNSKLETEKF